jgi:3-oxoacyl-[acyl-carrier-protein] synthase II
MTGWEHVSMISERRRPRIVITGLGPVSSIGIGKDAFWDRAREGRGYFRPMDFPEEVDREQFRCRICSPVDGLDLSCYFDDTKRLARMGKATRYTILGAYLALMDAGFELHPGRDERGRWTHKFSVKNVDSSRCGVIVGQAVANSDILLEGHRIFLKNRGPRKISPVSLPQSNTNVGASTVSEMFGFRGSCYTVSTACSSATHALGLAAASILSGNEDLVVTGGAEATLEPYFFSGFDIMRALSTRNDDAAGASRPFDRDRDGFVLGEGAGMLVLEELSHARRRGAFIYGEVAGWGFSADAYNVVAPDPLGTSAIMAVRKALDSARVLPEEVEYINAHGTATTLNDPTESFIIKQVFGDYSYRLPISSSKSFFGHPLGAAGGLESIVTLLIMNHGVIAPTSNLHNPDRDYVDRNFPHLDKRCDLDYVPLEPRQQNVGISLSESFGFGGQNAVVVLRGSDRGEL